jgi:hypothetical protein
MALLPATVADAERFLREARIDLERLRVSVRLARHEIERAKATLAAAKETLREARTRGSPA